MLGDAVRSDVLDAVHRWLNSTPDTPPESVLAGPLLDYVRIYREVPGLRKPLVWNSHVRELRIGEATLQSALCDCDIVTTDDFASSVWSGRMIGHITAPLAVERTDDGWRVVDFASGGSGCRMTPPWGLVGLQRMLSNRSCGNSSTISRDGASSRSPTLGVARM